mgnify:CR=1 FL=1
MYKILVTGSIHKIGLEMLRKEKDIEIQYAPDLAFAEIFKTNPKPRTMNRYASKRFIYNSLRLDWDHQTALDPVPCFE